MRNLIFISILSFMIVSCAEKDQGYNTSLLNEYCYTIYDYRNSPSDLRLDTVDYFFNKNDTLIAYGYVYKNENGVKVPLRKSSQSFHYNIKNEKSIIFPDKAFAVSDPIVLISDTTIVTNLPSAYEWQIRQLNKDQLVVDLFTYKGELVGHVEFKGKKRN